MNSYIISGNLGLSEPGIETSSLYAKIGSKSVERGLLIEYDRDNLFHSETKLDIRFIHYTTQPKSKNNVFFGGDWAESMPNQPVDFKLHGVGEKNYFRWVYVFDIPKEINLRAGLTVHSGPGTWSSWPMHEFEENSLNSPAKLYQNFVEKFVFITNPPGGWGLQAVVGRDSVVNRAVGDGEIVNIPLSFHPVVAAPNVQMAYFWAYTNGGEKFTKEGRV